MPGRLVIVRGVGMKGKGFRRSEVNMSCNEMVRVEMESFLQALESYPQRFASDPHITFEEYRSSLMSPVLSAPAESRQSSRES